MLLSPELWSLGVSFCPDPHEDECPEIVCPKLAPVLILLHLVLKPTILSVV